MEKFIDKKNLGVPAVLLCIMAYLIGYSLTISFNNLLVAVIFSFIVFSLQFDEIVKTATKQSFIFSFVVNVIYLVLDGINNLAGLMPNNYYMNGLNIISGIFNFIYKYGSSLLNIVVIVFYIIFILLAISKKEMKVGFLSQITDGNYTKEARVYQQPIQPIYQQPMQQSMQQPVQQFNPVSQPQKQQTIQGNICSGCGIINQPNAIFCAKCGNKIQ